MLTRDENELLTRVGPETPMGAMLRQYWIPALMSDELAPGDPPKRVRLLGENLVAFRAADGRLGLFDEGCPHRGASLVLAQIDDCALRCPYHGWKIDVSGRILETPTEPENSSFHERIRARAYPIREVAGLVWAYLGQPDAEPAFPAFEWTGLPSSHRWLAKMRAECNWLQCVEGVIDSSHVHYLHAEAFNGAANVNTSVLDTKGTVARPSSDGRPRIEAKNTPYGFRYAAIRKPLVDAETTEYVRVTLFVAPFFALIPPPAGLISMQIFVPIDDEHTMFYYVKAGRDAPLTDEDRKIHEQRSGMRPGIDFDDDFAKFRTSENLWQQDRKAMARGGSALGVDGVALQDIIVQESMGPVFDRTKEHLGASDVAVIRLRRLLLDAVRSFQAGDAPPLGLAEPVPYELLRAEERLVPLGTSWHTVGAFSGEEVTA
jgi:phthalate 4,5-dioxygenase